jgi:outer membrane protein assembly factor BamB
VCLDANSGKTIWQYRFNVYGSDVPPHRVGWASPVVDPATERIYVLGVCGTFLCLDRNGKLLWEHPLAEEFGQVTTHGGRTNTPIIFENLVVASGITASWGNQGRGGHRYIAFDKMTGDIVWVAQPGGQPYDTTYTTPVVAEIGEKTLLLDGGADGGIYALKARTGEKVWSLPFSKRGINTAIVTDGKWVYASHGEENLDTAVMGRIVALDPTLSGDISKTGEKWRLDGITVSYSSPALANGRIYAVDNGANLFCVDAATGKELWKQNLGTIQKASPVYADGKIYVGTENGKFFILKPGDKDCQVLDVDDLSKGAGDEEVIASAAVARGRVYLVSTKATYCIGSKQRAPAPTPPPASAPRAAAGSGATTFVQVVPAELMVAPGKEVSFKARSFDAAGNFIREEKATWSLAGLQGNISPEGKFSSPKGPQGGEVRAAVGGVTGTARVRVIPPLPWTEDFESVAPGNVPVYWAGVAGKYQVRDVEGNKVMVKLANEQSLLRRCRSYMGSSNLSNYTMEADVLGIEKRRQMPDIGITAQRYALILSGNSQKLWIESWQPETKRSRSVSFQWKPNVWYRMKIRVENTPAGKALVRGKVWLRESPEPDAWTIEREDPIPNLQGSPGLFAYAHNEIYYDNIKVTENSK